MSTPPQRLIDQIKPAHYKLSLDVDMETFRFAAQEQIEFELTTAAKTLTFHAVDLEITSAQLANDTAATSIVFDAETQTVALGFAAEVPAGSHQLQLAFAGTIQDSLHGFYRSSYEQGGQTKWLATTQFEPVHAREAFVCVDEPAAKAVFELDLTFPAGLTAIANTAAVSDTETAGRRHVQFAPTPKLSLYLVAYIIGEFEYVERRTPENVLVRAYATPGKLGQLEFALDTAVRTLSYYGDYFGIAYPLPKLDMIAIPDFASGAMENWGAVTYRETALLLDPNQTSLGQKQRVAEVITHELAHQWFGNLVTMAWWNDLWLNEGFASWVEVLAQDHLFPEWQVWTQFAAGDLAGALDDDALANTHAIEVEVEDPRALDEIFDGISYAKGASIINMLHHYLGAETFRRGLAQYLQQFQYGNATTRDLWAALEASSGQPVSQVMTAWTSLPGYPIVEIDESELRQERFYASARERTTAKSQAVWPLPLSLLTPQGELPTQLITETTAALPAAAARAAWLKPNAGQTGFYRVRYTPAMIEQLTPVLASAQLPAVDRFGLVSDVFATAEAGFSSGTVGLQLLQALRHETDYVAWCGLADGLGSLLAIAEDDRLRAQLEQFGGWVVQPAAQRLGWTAATGESTFDTLLRPLVLQQALRFDDAATTAEAQRRFAAYVAGQGVDPDLRGAILYGAARQGGLTEFEAIFKLYQAETVPQVKQQLLVSLCRFRQPELIQRSLELGLSEHVRPQDTIWTIGVGLQRRESRDLAWAFLQQNWPTMIERYGAGGHMLSYFPHFVGSGFASHAKASEVATFFAAHPHPAITRPVAQAVEAINLKANWAERDQAQLVQALTTWQTGLK
ncbi:MAG TPA: M1 family metallopeptidase [Candidatus Saccharimonadia bacterium]|nr:M1 family metallopeptidase [Candidatus Saccharimonadia bacterium]